MMIFNPVTTILGRLVEDIHGNPVGQVDELLIDGDDGQIAYLRLELVLDELPNPCCLTVPWSVVRMKYQSGKPLQLTVELSTLRRLAATQYKSEHC